MDLFQPSHLDRARTLDRNSSDRPFELDSGLQDLENRLGSKYLARRLRIEADHETDMSRKGKHFFSLENDFSARVLTAGLQLTGLYGRGRRNALSLEMRRHDVLLANLPRAFDGFTILHLSDLHIDITCDLPNVLIETIEPLDYDLCVLTGDYRARTFGPHAAALDGMKRLRPHIRTPVYAVLGNHDSIRMVPAMESMGYGFLINEHVSIKQDGQDLYVAGIDDAHFYRLENYRRAAQQIPRHETSILLSHTPEAYHQAADAGFDLMLCGHTHGGQICLPGGFPILTEATSPRQFARGAWRHHEMIGYTSVGAGTCIVDVRLNCRPEVTLHRLRLIEPEEPVRREAA